MEPLSQNYLGRGLGGFEEKEEKLACIEGSARSMDDTSCIWCCAAGASRDASKQALLAPQPG